MTPVEGLLRAVDAAVAREGHGRVGLQLVG
jgi:hypothetical protein